MGIVARFIKIFDNILIVNFHFKGEQHRKQRKMLNLVFSAANMREMCMHLSSAAGSFDIHFLYSTHFLQRRP